MCNSILHVSTNKKNKRLKREKIKRRENTAPKYIKTNKSIKNEKKKVRERRKGERKGRKRVCMYDYISRYLS